MKWFEKLGKYSRLVPLYATSLLLGFLLFFLFDALVTDTLDEYITSDIEDHELSWINYILFVYVAILFTSMSAPMLLLQETGRRRSMFVIVLAVAFTIVYTSFISFLYAGYGLRWYFAQMTIWEKLFGFHVWNAYFMAYILGSSVAYFAVVLAVFLTGHVLFYSMVMKRETRKTKR